MTAKRLPLQPADFAAMDRDPDNAAACIFDYAPRTLDAVIRLYCEAYADDPETYQGRHVETAELTGEEL